MGGKIYGLEGLEEIVLDDAHALWHAQQFRLELEKPNQTSLQSQEEVSMRNKRPFFLCCQGLEDSYTSLYGGLLRRS